MTHTPLVSVLMTSYNREKYIAEAIESVLASTFKDFELIICDDCSKDNTVSIAKELAARDSRVKVFVNEKNLGDYPNRNKAAGFATGKYIKYLDADDQIYYYGLEVMVNSMERFPDAGFGLGALPEGGRPQPILLSPREAYLEHFHSYAHFDRAPGSAIIKKTVFDHVGGFSGKRMIGDHELWFKLARYYPMVKFSLDLYWNRIHEEQESRSAYASLYPALRKEVLDAALAHPDCPLNVEEIGEIRKKKHRADKRNHLFSGMRLIRSFLKR